MPAVFVFAVWSVCGVVRQQFWRYGKEKKWDGGGFVAKESCVAMRSHVAECRERPTPSFSRNSPLQGPEEEEAGIDGRMFGELSQLGQEKHLGEGGLPPPPLNED